MTKFEPDYTNIVNAAYNKKAKRIPLYEHGISISIMEEIMNKKFGNLFYDAKTIDEFFRYYIDFFVENGYDTVTFEGCITSALMGGGALGSHVDPIIKNRDDFNNYPFFDIKNRYIKLFEPYFDSLRKNMPQNMKAIGGVGNGVFEIAQDLVSYEGLMLLSYDDPELYEDIFAMVGKVMLEIWGWFLEKYNDTFCVMRFGDDLGYKSNTLLPYEHIKNFILPEYKKIISLVHGYNRPFLLHSCGNIFNIFDDIISECSIDSKHSNEDVIAKFEFWVEKYGDKIGNFGGLDTDWICKNSGKSVEDIKERVTELYKKLKDKNGGFALSTGNSIPDYADSQKYLAMINTLRELRGDFS